MEALYILVPLSVVLVGVALWVFFGAADGGQFDDLEGPAYRVLQDDDRAGRLGGKTEWETRLEDSVGWTACRPRGDRRQPDHPARYR